jgi:hypothetical protein
LSTAALQGRDTVVARAQTCARQEGPMDKQLEMTQELSKARKWILGVGLVMFGVDMIMLHAVYADRLPSAIKNEYTMYSGIVLAFFLVMWVVAKTRPVLACVLALCGFWALHIYLATLDLSSLRQGVIMKVLFTLALIRGIKSANRAEQLKKELAQVFG